MTVRSRRRGSTLIEVLAAITLGAILLSLAGAVIVLMLRWDTTVLRRTAEERARSQLAWTLRDDADAVAAKPADLASGPTTKIKLDLGQGRQVEYRTIPGAVERRVIGSQGVEAAEQFRLAPRAEGEFQLVREQDRDFLRLRVHEPGQGRETARHTDFWAALPREAAQP